MAWCDTPFAIYRPHQDAVMDPATGEVKRQMVPCGTCPACIKTRKNDWTGRLTAEGLKAKETYFLTLTYKIEQDEFRYRDIQLMLYRLRQDFRKSHGATIRFFCVGERGNKYGRIHWHLLLFSDTKLGIDPWNKESNPGELWSYWPHGWAQVDPVPKADLVSRIRYCAKYAVKRIGDDLSCRPRFSLKPLLGWEYLREYAEQLAEKGLPFRGTYTIPGHVFTLGPRKGMQIKYKMRGMSARRASDAYLKAWVTSGRKLPWHETPFLQTYGTWFERTEFRKDDGSVGSEESPLPAYVKRIELWPETKAEMDWCYAPLQPMRQDWVADPDYTAAPVRLDAYRVSGSGRIRVNASKEQLRTIWAANRGAEEWARYCEERGVTDEGFERWLRENDARETGGAPVGGRH